MRACGGAADEADGAFLLQLLECVNNLELFGQFHRRVVQLQQIDLGDLHFEQRIGDIAADMVTIPEVGCFIVVAGVGLRATALGRDRELLAAAGKVTADIEFTLAVVVGGIDEVDAGVEDGVEDGLRLVVIARAAAPNAFTANFHGSIAELRDSKAGAAEFSGWQSHGVLLSCGNVVLEIGHSL